jgi:DNA-binding CsgD family transcriptional regulator/nucleoside-triphosphatase THEP1
VNPTAGPVPDGLVGRGRELARLASWLDGTRAGAGRLVLCAGEPGIGKTRLAQELADRARSAGVRVAWGACAEAGDAPALWPWRQVLRALGVDLAAALAGATGSVEDRFRAVDEVGSALRAAARPDGLLVVVDDVHRADPASLAVLRHVAVAAASTGVLVLAAHRDREPGRGLADLLPELAGAPGAERLDLRPFGPSEVADQLATMAPRSDTTDAAEVLRVTGGNPLFVREVARAIEEGTWRPERPPRSVLDAVGARLARLRPAARDLLCSAAVLGRDVAVPVLAAASGLSATACAALLDELDGHGLVDPVGPGAYRFCHVLVRDAVEAALPTRERLDRHRAAARALEGQGDDTAEHVADIARHWRELAPYGEGDRARRWTVRAGEDAVARLDPAAGARLYGLALDLGAAGSERCRLLVARGEAASAAGDLATARDAAVEASRWALDAGRADLAGAAGLVLEAVPDPAINAVARHLVDDALAVVADGDEAMRARLLARRSQLAFYDGDQDRVATTSARALAVARDVRGPDRDPALAAALRARYEACPGPAGLAERAELAREMVALGGRSGTPRTSMWGEIWTVETMVESGRLAEAAEELAALDVAVERVGGPVAAWHADRVRACVLQSRGRYDAAAAAAKRAFDRMSAVEPVPAVGAFFGFHAALSTHVGVRPEVRPFLDRPFDPPPRFRVQYLVVRASVLVAAGDPDRAAASYQQAGPPAGWELPVFFVVPAVTCAALVCGALGRHEELAALLARLEPHRGEQVSGSGVFSRGPVELSLGRGALDLGRLDAAVDDLEAAGESAQRCGAPGFVAEARHHLARALEARGAPGDHDRAVVANAEADRLARALGMTAYVGPTAVFGERLRAARDPGLTPRESEVAALVGEGLTNRQIAGRLTISERTAESHVQHVLTKLGFSSRSQIAVWRLGAGRPHPAP